MTVRLKDIKVGMRLQGLAAGGACRVVSVNWSGSRVAEVVYRDADNKLGERTLFREDEASLSVVGATRPWSFDGDGALLRLVSEATRFRLAWLFDPYVAISSSTIEPLPHQISAVYEEMLPRLPMRFLLADDPGAGKTIMAGLLIKEMIVRGDLQRCLIVSPGSLTEQWQEELHEKFGLEFDLLTRDMITASRTANPFENHHRLITRMDQLSRNEDLRGRLEAADEWDLIIVDEAHRMSAAYVGGEVKRTKRYDLGTHLGKHTRNLLLMTATPHNGIDDSFQLFLALLDGDRFEGKRRDGVHTQDPSDLMRRMVKEELVRFDGTPLFPERRSYTAEYHLSPPEAHLYQEVTEYVRNQMNLADRLEEQDGSRRVNVGFALMTLQRRLASSPRAIHISLQRRRERLGSRLREERAMLSGRLAGEAMASGLLDGATDFDELYDDTPQDELDELEAEVVDNATAARSIEELQTEIAILEQLEEVARDVVRSGQDAKWSQLQELLESEHMVGANHERRKLVIFSEFKDTLAYLHEKITTHIGRQEAVVQIHGSIGREERRKVVSAFMNDPEVVVLIANDAAGEGVNLQRAHLMVNYDLPWNPNRLEQRFGRIHRIGQKDVCHLWNLIAKDTREGDVYVKLMHKIEAEREALGGKVFDVLGELFDQTPLRNLLQDAIRYGEDPEVKARITRAVDGALDHEHILEVSRRSNILWHSMDREQIEAIKDEMDRAEARRLQPHFVEAFFREAFVRLGGRIQPRESGRFEITHVPQAIRDRDRQAGTGAPVLDRYERICFGREFIDAQPRAELIGLGHPLLDATIALVIERHGDSLKRGAVLIDERDPSTEPHLLFYLQHGVQDGRRDRSGTPRLISNEIHFVEIGPSGSPRDVGAAPYLDYRPLDPSEQDLVQDQLDAEWMRRDWDREVRDWANREVVPKHLKRVQAQRVAVIDKIAEEVRARLTAEIHRWDQEAQALREKERAGKRTRLPAHQAERRCEVLAQRLQARQAELELERAISPTNAQVIGGALVLPGGLMRKLRGEPGVDPDDGVDAEARRQIELLAMEAVTKAERRLGRMPRDVSATKGIGHDLESKSPETGETLRIEVKGRVAGAREVTLTVNEIRCARNVPDRFRLAIVQVEAGEAREPIYIRGDAYDFGQPGFEQTSSNYSIHSLLQRGTPPE